jgi:hypothetical protein
MKFSVKLEWTESGYRLLETVVVYSRRYDKYITALEGEFFDGASGAIDVCPMAWIPHDVLCRDGKFDDGTPCTNLQASHVVSDQLKIYGRGVRSKTWFLATFLFGGKGLKKF